MCCCGKRKYFLILLSPCVIIVHFHRTINIVYLKIDCKWKNVLFGHIKSLMGTKDYLGFIVHNFGFNGRYAMTFSISCLVLRDLHYLHLYFPCNKAFIIRLVYIVWWCTIGWILLELIKKDKFETWMRKVWIHQILFTRMYVRVS